MEFKPGDHVAFVLDRIQPNRLAMHETPFGRIAELRPGKQVMTVNSVPYVRSIYKYSGFDLMDGTKLNEHVVRRYEVALDGPEPIAPTSHPLKCWLSRSKNHPGWRARFDYEGGEFEVDIVPYNPDEIYT
jgi:hypothetical protein